MGTVVDFPERSVRGAAYLEAQLKQLLSDKGADDALIEFAGQQLAASYARLSEAEQYSFSVYFPDSLSEGERETLQSEINSGLEGIRRENHGLLLELVAKLLLTEIQLFQEQRHD